MRYCVTVTTVLQCWRRCEEGREEEEKEDCSGRGGGRVKPPISCVLQSPGRGRKVLTSHRVRDSQSALASPY